MVKNKRFLKERTAFDTKEKFDYFDADFEQVCTDLIDMFNEWFYDPYQDINQSDIKYVAQCVGAGTFDADLCIYFGEGEVAPEGEWDYDNRKEHDRKIRSLASRIVKGYLTDMDDPQVPYNKLSLMHVYTDGGHTIVFPNLFPGHYGTEHSYEYD